MVERVRVGVIGAGAIATLRHLPAFRRMQDEGKAELVGVADPVEAATRSAAERFGLPHAVADYRDLLALPLDAVSICTPKRVMRRQSCRPMRRLTYRQPTMFIQAVPNTAPTRLP